MVFAGLFAAQALNAVAGIVLARRVEAVNYSQYLASVGLATILVALVNLGMDQWLLASGGDSPTHMIRAFCSGLRIRLPLLALWLIGVALLAQVLPPAAFPRPYLLLAGLGVGCDSVTLLSYSVLRNLGRHRTVTYLQGAAAVLILLAALVLPLAPGQASEFLMAKAVISAVVAVLTIARVQQTISPPLEPVEPAIAVVRSTLPFMWSELAVAVYMRADLSILSLLRGSAAASIYGPATSLLSMCFLAPNALYLLVVPTLARLSKRPDQEFRRFALTQLLVQALIGVLLFVGVLALAPWLIRIVLGPNYAASAETLRLLSPILLFKSLSFGLGAWLTAGGEQASRTRIQVYIAVLNLFANLAIITQFGVTGIAVVYVISEVLLALGYGMAIKKVRNRRTRTGQDQ